MRECETRKWERKKKNEKIYDRQKRQKIESERWGRDLEEKERNSDDIGMRENRRELKERKFKRMEEDTMEWESVRGKRHFESKLVEFWSFLLHCPCRLYTFFFKPLQLSPCQQRLLLVLASFKTWLFAILFLVSLTDIHTLFVQMTSWNF